MSYEPPFKISSTAINLISKISADIERFKIRLEQADSVMLRKVNRMKTIQGSLAIEGNSLSEEQVTTLIEGKAVIAPIREVQEVKNAIKAYELSLTLNPFKQKDLLKAHSAMTMGLVDSPGHFRNSDVCVGGKNGISHIAPPADRVPFLMKDLFDWLKKSEHHPLIKSSVFHYEFEFIHPFQDGNGRMGRLWHSMILADWNPIFLHTPIENMIFKNQAGYYKAIEKSTEQSDSGIFIDFMLNVIMNSINENRKQIPARYIPADMVRDSYKIYEYDTVNETVSDTVNDISVLILKLMKENPKISYDRLAEKTGKSRITISRKISHLKKTGKVWRVGADKNGYWQTYD